MSFPTNCRPSGASRSGATTRERTPRIRCPPRTGLASARRRSGSAFRPRASSSPRGSEPSLRPTQKSKYRCKDVVPSERSQEHPAPDEIEGLQRDPLRRAGRRASRGKPLHRAHSLHDANLSEGSGASLHLDRARENRFRSRRRERRRGERHHEHTREPRTPADQSLETAAPDIDERHVQLLRSSSGRAMARSKKKPALRNAGGRDKSPGNNLLSRSTHYHRPDA